MRPIAALALLPVLAAAPALAERVEADYAVTALGMTIMEVRVGYDTTERGYALAFTSRLRGMASAMGDARQETRASGTWSGAGVQPVRYDANGVWRGEPRRTVVEWQGAQPVIRTMVPPNEAEREEVPAARQRGAVDSLSAVARLMRQVGRDGRCDSTGEVFDGRRLTTMTARTVGWEQLPPARGEWSGRALRCQFEGRLVAGFHRDNNGEEARRPTPGTAWFGEVVPGVPPIPVRIESQTRWFGTMTARLVNARLVPGQASAQ